jgi:site-specific DNA-methyltransferase (adenine-specific)
MAVRIEDAGFEIRDMIAWVYGSGFPKSLDVSKAIDKAAGAEREVVGLKPNKGRVPGTIACKGLNTNIAGDPITAAATPAARQWQGWGTALKPALEPITIARKPLIGTVAENVLAHGTGAINVDGCRVQTSEGDYSHGVSRVKAHEGFSGKAFAHTDRTMTPPNEFGRWPANLIHDGSNEVVVGFPQTGISSGGQASKVGMHKFRGQEKPVDINAPPPGYGDSGSAARFFYCAKASKADRDEGLDTAPKPFVQFQTANGTSGKPSSLSEGRNTEYRNNHPTVKPTDLMRYLCRLVTPPGGIVLDPFMGSGSTGKAAVLEGFQFIGIEREAEYVEIAKARISNVNAPLL